MPATEVTPLRSLTPRALFGVTMLLVQSEQTIPQHMRLSLRQAGVRLRRAETCFAAQQHLRTYRPHIVIVDLAVSGGDGLDLIAELASLTDVRPRIIALTGPDTVSEQIAHQHGADRVIATPIATYETFALHLAACTLNVPRETGQPRKYDGDISAIR